MDPSVMPVGHGVTYEDPDIHMGHHRPLVMRQHPLNVEVRTRRKFVDETFEYRHLAVSQAIFHRYFNAIKGN